MKNNENELKILLDLIFTLKHTNLKNIVTSLNISSYVNILTKLNNGTLRYSELKAILEVIDVEIVFRDKISKREY